MSLKPSLNPPLTKEQLQWLGLSNLFTTFTSREDLNAYLESFDKQSKQAAIIASQMTWNTCIQMLADRKLLIAPDFEEDAR